MSACIMEWGLLSNFIFSVVNGAFIGWVTTYLAILMIFRPRRPFRLLWWDIQGIVPKKRHELAMSIGRSVERDMISVDDFQDLINQVDLEAEIEKIIDNYINEKVRSRLSERSFIGRAYNRSLDGMKAQMKAYLAGEINRNVNEIIKSFIFRLETDFDIQEIVTKRIDSYDLETLENVVFGFTKREFKFLEIMGGVFGFLLGVAQFFWNVYTLN